MKSETMEQHQKKAPIKVKCGVITLSDSKYEDFIKTESNESDISGKILMDLLDEKYDVAGFSIIPDDGEKLLFVIENMIHDKIEVIITTGGTGIGSRDITIETLKPVFEKELDGFGEIFRAESYKELGAGALISRATAGVYKKTLLIALPGSPNAVKLGLNIVLDELGHLVKHLRE